MDSTTPSDGLLCLIISKLEPFVMPSLVLLATAVFAQILAFQQQKDWPPFLASAKSFDEIRIPRIPNTARQVHVVILVHGFLGEPGEMGSIHRALEKQIEQATTGGDQPEKKTRIIPKDTYVVMHSASCNYGKTLDGVLMGGCRLAEEVNDFIKHIVGGDDEEGISSEAKISLSFIGNSLGGLYSRSCLADVAWNLPRGHKVAPNIFCTTSTPHLGKQGLTYIPVPRFVEQGLGYALKPTGQDLFGVSTVIRDLATKPKYMAALKNFQKRILYSSCYGTDFLVPTSTAAFLSDTDSPHQTQESNPPFLLTVSTPRNEKILESIDESGTSAAAARNLDALGWVKVFCDLRDEMVSVPIPFGEEGSSDLAKKDTWTSQELRAVVADGIVHDKKWTIPFGHPLLVANAKTEVYAKFNSGGLPYVEQLVTEFLDDVLKCT